jgi:glutathione S-transferase
MYLTNTVQAELLTYFYPQRLTDDDETMAQVVRRNAEARVGAMLDILDAELERSGGPWLLGSRYSVADPYLFMVLRWTRGMQRPARTVPRLGRFLEAMAARPAVQRAMTMEKLPLPWY